MTCDDDACWCPRLLLAAAQLAGCANNGDRRYEAADDAPAKGVTEVVVTAKAQAAGRGS